MHHHEAATAEISGAGQGDGQRQRHGDARIHRVAAVFQHLQPDVCGDCFLHRDHGLFGPDRMHRIHRAVDRRFLGMGGSRGKRDQGGGGEGGEGAEHCVVLSKRAGGGLAMRHRAV